MDSEVKVASMAYWLLFGLREEISFFRIFGYTNFRMVMAALTSLAVIYWFGPRFIQFLCKLKFKENIRNDGPSTHATKAGTPTMGGLMIVTALSLSNLLWMNFSNHYAMLLWVGTLILAGVGFIDDYLKAVQNVPRGMRAKTKMAALLMIAGCFSVIVYLFPYLPSEPSYHQTDLFIPFLKDPIWTMGLFAIPFWTIIITGTSNAVNLTDGLDGLAVGVSTVVLLTLGIIAYLSGVFPIADYLLIPFIPESNEIAVILASLIGACVGFLWYNSYPAEVFMGDTGSLAIGGSIGMTAILIHREILLILLGGIFVAEAISVILQVASFKARGKRIFKMAPLHHHFELMGCHENKVVIRFWIVGIFLALISLSSLKIN